MLTSSLSTVQPSTSGMFHMLPLEMSWSYRKCWIWKYHRGGSYTSSLAPLFLHCVTFLNFFCKNCAKSWFYLLRYPLFQYEPLLHISTSFEFAEFLNYLFEYCLLFTSYKQGRDLYNSMDSEMNSWGQDLMSAITPMNWRNKLAVLTEWRDYTRRHKIATLLVWTVSTIKQAVTYSGALRDCGALDQCSVRGRRPLKMWCGVGLS
jgi:hypothetical protein